MPVAVLIGSRAVRPRERMMPIASLTRECAVRPRERMNSPLGIRKVRLRGLGGPAVCGVSRTCASATRDYRVSASSGMIRRWNFATSACADCSAALPSWGERRGNRLPALILNRPGKLQADDARHKSECCEVRGPTRERSSRGGGSRLSSVEVRTRLVEMPGS